MHTSYVISPPWRLLVILLISSQTLCAPGHARAQSARKAIPQDNLHFKLLGRDEGLQAGVIYCVMEDRQGFIWLGTRFGLKRYDGYEFKSYDALPTDSSNYLSGPITSICEDSRLMLWIAVKGGGLVSFDRRNNKVTAYRHDEADPTSLSAAHIVALHVDAARRLWAISSAWEMNLYDTALNRFTKYRPPWEILPEIIGLHNPIVPEIHGKVILPDHPEITFDLNKRTFAREAVSKVHHESARIMGHDQDSSWLGICHVSPITKLAVYVLINTRTGAQRELPIEGISKPMDYAQDRHDNGLLLTSLGLFKLDLRSETVRQILVPGLVQPSCVYVDRAERIWVGGAAGLYLCAGLNTSFFTHQLPSIGSGPRASTKPPSIVRALSAHDGSMRAGDQYGKIYRWDGDLQRFQTFGQLQKRRGDQLPYALHQITTDRKGQWLYAGNAGPIFRSTAIDPGYDLAVLKNWTGFAVCQDHRSSIWIGTRTLGIEGSISDNSLVRYEPDTKVVRQYSLRLPYPLTTRATFVFSLLEDRHDQLWIGSSAGLFKYDRATDSCLPVLHPRCDGSGYAPNNIWVIFEDSRDNLWLGSWGRGLHRFDRATNTYTDFTTRDGLPDNNIQSILEDESGDLWIGTSRGLCRFDPVKGFFTNFGIADGLPDDEFQPKAAARLASGEMFFGAIGGITSFFPSLIKSRDLAAPIALTSLHVSGVELGQLSTNDVLRLSYDRNDLVFEYALLDFSSNDRKRYDYILVGLDEDWVHASSRHIASYNNIPPGEYLLRIRGSNTNAPWNGNEMRLRISISPPYWQTWWFISAIGLTFAGALGLIAERGRRRQLDLQLRLERAREKERMDLAGDIHDGPLQDLYATRFLIEDDSSELAQLLSVVRGDLRSISSVLQPPKLQFGLIEELDILVQAFRQRCPDTSFQMIALGDQRQLPEGVGRNIFRIVRTALTNVQKHSTATSCVVTASYGPKGLEVSIADNGIGFDPKSLDCMGREHFGLFLMKCYAKEIQASINVEAVQGEGTTIRLRWSGKRFTLSNMRSLRAFRKQQTL